LRGRRAKPTETRKKEGTKPNTPDMGGEAKEGKKKKKLKRKE